MTADATTTLIERYAAAPARLRRLLQSIEMEALDRSVEGEWTAREILCHLADSELVGAVRMHQLLAEDGPAFAVYDQDGWARSLAYARNNTGVVLQAIELFATLRDSAARLLRRAPAERWEAWGRHPERGRMTLREVVTLYADHAEAHQEQLRRVLGIAAPDRAEEPTVGRGSTVTLREITADTLRPILRLEVSPDQKGFVAPNPVSIAQAHFSEHAWFRAIYADETPVGFIMLSDDAQKSEYYLWRMMIGAPFQGMGFGRHAVLQCIEYVKTRPGAKELRVSYVPGEGTPRDFYHKLGFVETGVKDGDEIVARLPL